MKFALTAVTTLALVAGSAAAALATGTHTQQQGQTEYGERDRTTVDSTMDDALVEEERFDEVAGVRVVPSIIGREVSLTPSPWYLRGAGRNANANAKIYTNREGAITGVTVRSWGLPNPESVRGDFNDYVVWLVDSETNSMKNIGTLESRNRGLAHFGYTPEMPLTGYDRIVITPEPTFAASWPTGWQQLEADLPATASLPSVRPMQQPMMQEQRPMEPLAPQQDPLRP